MTAPEGQAPTQEKIIGILGGLGPYAHIDFERKLLESARTLIGISSEQNYPEWVLSCIPGTPDRTEAILGKAPDPSPWLLRSLDVLERAGADFAVVPCNTACYFLRALGDKIALPVLDMISEAVACVRRLEEVERVGILATTGTLETRLYHDALSECGLEALSPLDLPEGEKLQQVLVMEAIYGRENDESETGGGIKASGNKPEFEEKLEHAAALLVEDGAQALIAGCTEIPLSLQGPIAAGVPLIDPTRALAEASIREAYGLR